MSSVEQTPESRLQGYYFSSGRSLRRPDTEKGARSSGRLTTTSIWSTVPSGYWILAVLLLIMPALASDFTLFQIFGWTFILGMIALSLMFLGGYGGMVSLVQMSVAGMAGYMVAILGTSAITDISMGWPWWLSIPLALVIAIIFGTG